MARRDLTHLTYQAIRIEGGLIPADELTRLTTLQAPDKTEQKDAQYGIPKGLKLRDEVARFWKIAQILWSEFEALRQRTDVDAHRATVQDFMVPLLRDVLGYADLAPGATVQGYGHIYNIGYAARAGRLPVILAPHTQALDMSTERFGDLNPDTGKTRRRSPFMLAQEALNASDAAFWALASNGLVLRILHNNPSLTRPAYVEIDLEAIFTEDLYADFTAFWLLAHASRFGRAESEPADCAWERWRAIGQEAGVTIRSNLRYQVAQALRALGTGFLSHPSNTQLREQLQNQSEGLGKQAFFEELLGLVYRLIFLSTVEDRVDPGTGQPLIFAPGTRPEVQQRYLSSYSLTWLRERAARRNSFDTHSDLWQALSITFDALANGQSALGLPALGGLFDSDQCLHLSKANIENRWLLSAVFQLGYFRQASSLTRVNYRDMGPEELGSVYESLLELVPDIQNLGQPLTAKLAFVGDEDTDASTKGNTRKLTGSYYTPDILVQELVKSALEPVITQTLQDHPERPVEALLQLTICDPACGSGHFLLAAARRLADEVAKLRAAQSHVHTGVVSSIEPFGEQQAYRHALRDVVSHCIYGVDKNPMAIALAKTALWLEAYTPDRPLTFLDHHLQVGDALLGVLDPNVLEDGIPDEAYAVLSGDDKATAGALRKQNKADVKSWKDVTASDLFKASGLAAQVEAVEHLADENVQQISAKRSAWRRASGLMQRSMLACLADTYVAAFLSPKVPERFASTPLSGHLWGLLHPAQGQPPKAEVAEAAYRLCRAHSVFHWWLAFPQVAARGGFAVMLGNPPWEVSQFGEEEFFASKAPSVAALAGDKRKRAIAALETEQPWLWQQARDTKRGYEAVNLFFRESGRYPLSAVGKLNTYRLFAEAINQLLSLSGRAGFIVPTGIATDDSSKAFFGAVIRSGRLAQLVSFYEVRRWFPATDERKPFCLFTIGTSKQAQFIFDVDKIEDLQKQDKWYELTPQDFERLNPNTLTLPTFRSQRDAELSKKLYGAAPVLIAEAQGEATHDVNPWGIRFSQGLFNMTSASGLFQKGTKEIGTATLLPLYEGKMIHQFDHRWATFLPDGDKANDDWESRDVTALEKSDVQYSLTPRHWVNKNEVLARLAQVPSSVASAWLEWCEGTHMEEVKNDAYIHPISEQGALHGAGASSGSRRLAERAEKLNLALAKWVAGELFRREAGPPTFASAAGELGWPPASAWQAAQEVETALNSQYPSLARALKGDDISGKKALLVFIKSALQDAAVNLSDEELLELKSLRSVSRTKVGSHPAVKPSPSTERGEEAYDLHFLDEWMERRSPRWLMGWRDITNAAAERTVIASVIPRMGVGNNLPLMLFGPLTNAAACAALLGNLDSIVLDFVARNKVGGTHLNFFIYKQLPILPPETYTEAALSFIVPRVLELTHTANDLQAWAEDLAAYDPRAANQRTTPFRWNPERRAVIRAELDAYYGRLYGLTRDELRYILDPADVMGTDYPSETFRVLKNNEMREFGEYRTQRLVLQAWDGLAADNIASQPSSAGASSPVYSAQGVIRTQQEGEFAGLIAALVSQCAEGISVYDLQDVVAYVPMAATYMASADSARLRLLAGTVDVLAQGSSLTLIPAVVQRLETSGAIVRKRSGNTNLYFLGGNALPTDVSSGPPHQELARLMLMLFAARRALVQGNQDGKEGQEQQANGGR